MKNLRMNDKVNMSKQQVTEIPAFSHYAGQQTRCEDCGRVWLVEFNNEVINLCLDKDNLKEIKKPTFLLTVLREKNYPLAKVASSNSPARLTCVVICPEDKYAYQWKVNHKGKGSAAYSGCKLDPALHRHSLKRKDSQTSDYNDEGITTFNPLNRKRRKFWIDKNVISGDMRTEKSYINSYVRKESNEMNFDARTDEVLKPQHTMHIENICETKEIAIDDSRNVDFAVKDEIEVIEIKEKSLKEENQYIFEATDQYTDPLDVSNSLPEPNTKGTKCLEAQEGKFQRTNMGSLLLLPSLNCLDTMVQAQAGQEMQAPGLSSQMAQTQTGQEMLTIGQHAQILQTQNRYYRHIQAKGLSLQTGQEMPVTGQNAQMVQAQTGQGMQGAGLSSQTDKKMLAAGKKAQMGKAQPSKERQATVQNSQVIQVASQLIVSAGIPVSIVRGKTIPQAIPSPLQLPINPKIMHPSEENNIQPIPQETHTRKCRNCKIVFDNAFLFFKHIKKQKYPTCAICTQYFKTEKYLAKHVRYVHYRYMSDDMKAKAIEKTGVPEVSEKFSRKRIICHNDSCMDKDRKFNTLVNLREHMHHIHNEDHPQITHTFDTFEDFEKWKDEEEGKIGASYYKTRSGEQSRRNNATKKRFFCKRSGTYTPNGQGLRKLKSIGSSKIGSFCTSTMEVEECNKTKRISLTYYSKHSGHEMDINNVLYNQLCRKDREKISAKVMQGVPRNIILEEVRETANNERAKYLTMTDIDNVISSITNAVQKS